jgi:type IV secretion system protein VirB10
MSRVWLLILVIILAGCKEKNPSPALVPETKAEVDKAMVAPSIKLPALPKPDFDEKSLNQDFVAVEEFPDPEPLEREYAVKDLRSKRVRRQHGQIFKKQRKPIESKTPKTKWHMHDEDYAAYGQPVDTSTYPTDLSRMILETQRITGVLEDEVNSQIEGRAVVVVDKSVPSADFTHVLIPAGSKMVCQYGSLEKIGETRLNFFCTRLVRPDGVSIIFAASNEKGNGEAEAMSGLKGADQMGRAGLIGEVDNKAFERYGSAFLVSAISGLSQIGYNKDQTNSNMQHFSHQFGNNLAQITAKLLDESIDLTPSINIKGGSLIQLRPAADIYFRKPRPEAPINPKPMETIK